MPTGVQAANNTGSVPEFPKAYVISLKKYSKKAHDRAFSGQCEDNRCRADAPADTPGAADRRGDFAGGVTQSLSSDARFRLERDFPLGTSSLSAGGGLNWSSAPSLSDQASSGRAGS